jgi:GR25 family glycosyltransferase involved in LPS biosynthesis
MNIFFHDLPVYFINLDRRKDRLDYFLDHAAVLGINSVHRFKAVDGSDITKKIDGLSNVQIACSTSHILVLKEFLKSKFNFAMICEDDVDLSNSQKINFNFYELLEHMPKPVECIQTSLVLRKEDVMPFKISQRSMFYFSTASYIISREYAQYLIDKYYTNIVDLSIFQNSYVLDPRGGTMELNAVADQLIYESAGTLSIGLFTTILDKPDISTTTEQIEQFVSSRKQFTDYWNEYETIKIKDITK